MRRELLEKLSEFAALLDSDPRLVALNEEEKVINGNEEVLSLSKELKKAEETFEDARSHYGEKGELTKQAQKALFAAKLSLDSHPEVKKYNEAYVQVKDLYLYIDDILFSDFRSKKDCLSEVKHA
ncbi:MAG: YlbF family regulator [Bacilli bacterium]|nr:YlbF family regulator [Bacilli bacterium]